MKTKRSLSFFALLVFLFFQGCSSDPKPVNTVVKDSLPASKAIQQQIAQIEQALSGLAKSTYNDSAIGLDTAELVVNLDTMDEAEAIHFRLNVLAETIQSMNASKNNKSVLECDSVLVGTYSCNCSAPPNVSGGAVHCDLCGIYKVVCK